MKIQIVSHRDEKKILSVQLNFNPSGLSHKNKIEI